ncbi:DUF4126 domain-containing protein [Desulfopila sp. IMCC35008]|uniref:DUF4126 domain-containing protein n=1 Tax=Desulfopila sp. IMCC35008 TaxID=2653858 RepID=UPI0013D582AF|nr:DUF4126 domain-containing protein [Desulfopila sp. IMCC35008]
MDPYQSVIATIALTMGTAWASGINLYATIGMLGILGATGNIILPETLVVVQDPLVIMAAAVMYCVEFFADKTPGVDTGWDVIHSFIRIPAGVILSAAAVGDVTPALSVTAGILGGTVTATSHMVKAGSRVLINSSPEPFTNWTASVAEDVAVVGGLWAALNYPLAFLAGFILFICLTIWILPRIWRGIKLLFGKIKAIFNKDATQDATSLTPPQPPRIDGGKGK